MHLQWLLAIILVCALVLPLYILLRNVGNCDIKPLYNARDFIIENEGCMIPNLDPCDPSILEYIYGIERADCRKGSPYLVYSNLSTLHLNKTSLFNLGLQEDNVTCVYCPFSNTFPLDHSPKKCNILRNRARIKDDYVTVYCNYSIQGINQEYKDLFTFLHHRQTESNENHEINILAIVLDGASRINFHRHMPLTSRVMKRLQAVEFLGYNKVGLNSYPNVVPILTGISVDQLSKTCLNSTKFYDNCSIIWEDYKARGYTTLYGADEWFSALLGKYEGNLFQKQPTDYYWSPFLTLTDGITWEYKCFGVKSLFKMVLDYISTFVETMKKNNENYFGFIWTEAGSHRNINNAQLADEDLALFMSELIESVGNETIVIILGDHGIRYGDIRRTPQGSIEDQLPLLNIYLPSWFRTNYSDSYKKMLDNTRKLTTPYDLHETLLDLADLSRMQTKSEHTGVGYSLFDDIPHNRTCKDAQISPHYCACHDNEIIDVTDEFAYEIANFAASEKLISNYTVSRVINFRKHLYKNQKFLDFEDYTIFFKVNKHNLEATVRKLITSTGYKLVLTDKVSRLNDCEYCRIQNIEELKYV